MGMIDLKIANKGGKKFRMGIIGTGGIAHSHMKAYASFPNVEVVALCDHVSGKADSFAKEFGMDSVAVYHDYKEMLDREQLDGVSICTYNCQHRDPTVYALNKGVNVLLEKPFSVTLEEAADMMKAEKESGKILTIGFQPRFDVNMQLIKKIVDSGELGKVYYIQTGGGRRRGIPVGDGSKTSFIEKDTAGIGALADIGCYSLDMVLNAIGYPKPLTVSGFKTDYFGKNPKTFCDKINPQHLADVFGVDDFAGAFVRLEGGVFLDFRISWAMNINTPGDTILLGTEGGLRIPSTDCWNGSTGGPMTIYRTVAGQNTEEIIPVLKSSEADGTLWQRKIYFFLDAIANDKPAPVPTSQIIINQAIISGIVDSSNCGREVEIQLPEI